MKVILENKAAGPVVLNIPGQPNAIYLGPRRSMRSLSAPIEVDPEHGLGPEVLSRLGAKPPTLAVRTVE